MPVPNLDRFAIPIGAVLVAVGTGLIILNLGNAGEFDWGPLPVVGVGLGLILGGVGRSKKRNRGV